MVLSCGFTYGFKELSKLPQTQPIHSLIVPIMRTHTLTFACLHRPAAYPAFYQVTKVGCRGLQKVVKGGRGELCTSFMLQKYK